jgi:hypothetical protein
VVPENLQDVVEQIAPLWTLQPLLFSCLREGLAGRTGAQDVMFRDSFDRNLAYVSDRLESKVLLIEGCEIRIDLASKDTLVPEAFQSKMKAAEAGEKVNKPKSIGGTFCQKCAQFCRWKAITLLMRKATASGLVRMSDSHTRKTFQPSRSSTILVRRSRLRLLSIFATQ